ncbi:hypothetical protein TrRE_jg59 [Triparma retinervis]|uniref:Phosphoglycerate mutase-like protein n=1 Tax=Triparma retinervis TaxID=2557542 RepID=A0A9W7E6W6_9STRA|nr:hypothetical protein TrRE_jg59 [Triparma retinervis]
MSTNVLYLVRHGSRFDYDNPTRWSEISSLPTVLSTDPPLNHFGFKQAELTGSYLHRDVLLEERNLAASSPSGPSGVSTRCMSSLYQRVLQTARPFASYHGILISPEPGILEYGHHYNTLEEPGRRIAQCFPEVDLGYEPLTKLEEVDWKSTTEREDGVSYMRRILRFESRYSNQVNGRDTIDVMFSHAASSSLVAAMTGLQLEEVGKFAPCGIFKLRRSSGSRWVIELYGSDNLHSLPPPIPSLSGPSSSSDSVSESMTRPWGYEQGKRDYRNMWKRARELEFSAPPLYHLVLASSWSSVPPGGLYYPPTYNQDGFTHLTEEPALLVGVGNLFYKKPESAVWVCLEIDGGRLGEGLVVKYEPAAPVGGDEGEGEGGGEEGTLFPHLYGGVEKDAVRRVMEVKRLEDGTFVEIVRIKG